MRYSKPCYYDTFRCIADRCPDNCCEGWQIVIDEEALETYRSVEGAFGDRLRGCIDWSEGVFRQQRGRCSCLREDGLCDLQKELGEQYLCRTCTLYPRHVEEYEGLREWSLSLSCPEAARMILADQSPYELIWEETEEEEELAEEFEEFDLLLFSQLEEARELLFAILKNRAVSFWERVATCRQMVCEMQACIDEERYYDVDEVLDRYQTDMTKGLRVRKSYSEEPRYERAVREFQLLKSLERLRPEWSGILDRAWNALYAEGENHYEELCRKYEEIGKEVRKLRERASENLMFFFLYTYFCGAVYDDWIYSKFALCEFSVFWIGELVMAQWAAGETVTEQSFVELAYRYAREIEHSDENLNMLEEWLNR